jgi:hypothetical protein
MANDLSHILLRACRACLNYRVCGVHSHMWCLFTLSFIRSFTHFSHSVSQLESRSQHSSASSTECEVWGSHGNNYEDLCLLGYDDVMSLVRRTPALIRSLLPPSSVRRKSATTLRLEAPGSFKTLINNLPNSTETNLYHWSFLIMQISFT